MHGAAVIADDTAFVKALGRRLAALRKEAGLSQQAVADQRGVALQTQAHYEVGAARMPVSIVPALARLDGVDANERLHQLLKTQQKVVMQMLDGVLAQASR